MSPFAFKNPAGLGAKLLVLVLISRVLTSAQEPDVSPSVILATVEARLGASNSSVNDQLAQTTSKNDDAGLSDNNSGNAVRQAIGQKIHGEAMAHSDVQVSDGDPFVGSNHVVVPPAEPSLNSAVSSLADNPPRVDEAPSSDTFSEPGLSLPAVLERSIVSSFSKGEQETPPDSGAVIRADRKVSPQTPERAVEETDIRALHHHSILDVMTMVVVLVMAVLVLPLAFAYRVSGSFRSAILALSSKPNMSKKSKEDDIDYEKAGPGLDIYQPRMLVPSTGAVPFRSVLSNDDLEKLVKHLPYHLTAKDWQLLYASELHGYSLHAAYRRVAGMGPCIIAGMDMKRSVFAAFCSETLKPNGTNYFGNGECWVASVSPHFQVHKWKPGNNEQFVLASDSFLGFGGGGTFALWFDAQFDRGTSEANSTFGNTTFLTSVEAFKLVSVEIWGFTNPSFRGSLGTKALKTVSSVMGRIASKASTTFSTTGATGLTERTRTSSAD